MLSISFMAVEEIRIDIAKRFKIRRLAMNRSQRIWNTPDFF